jgi:formylglycine-generating enzyme required for sulfatase activity
MQIGRIIGVGSLLILGILLTSCAPVPQSGSQVTGYDVRQTFRDCQVCPEMVVMPTGSFRMGSDKISTTLVVKPNKTYLHKFRARVSEQPSRVVAIRGPIAVGKFEIKFSEWDACVSAGGCNGYLPDDNGWGRGPMPVFNINWHDAKSYVTWMRDQTGRPYRLLSEAEWEFVTRAGSQTASPNVSKSADTCTIGNTGASTCVGAYGASTSFVGSFRVNAFGLYDTIGNVNEWVEDCWHQNYIGAPTTSIPWEAGGDCTRRVIRGSTWNSYNWEDATTTARWGVDTKFRGFNTTGFRIALDL